MILAKETADPSPHHPLFPAVLAGIAVPPSGRGLLVVPFFSQRGLCTSLMHRVVDSTLILQ